MKKSFLKKAAALCMTAVLLLAILPSFNAEAAVPVKIRIGLYYTDTSAGVNTAQTFFDVSAPAGLSIGFSTNDNFTEIYKETGSSKIYIRKDAYYYNNGTTLKEYTSSSDSNAASAKEKYGPYHIKIGSDFTDAQSAETQALAYRQAGIPAAIAYNDSWQVWAYSFTDEASAKEQITKLIPILGEVGYAVIEPSTRGIVAVNSQYQPLCYFSSNTSYFWVKPNPENSPSIIDIKGSKYRGALEVKRLTGSDMTVINIVTVNEYLYGNVPCEIGGKSPAEAIKAQAVAAKMFAVNNMGRHSKTGFDICATTNCQVYKGYSAEIQSCNDAIDQVADKIITYNGKPAQVFYFASSGGRTEDVKNVWGSSYPYLVSVEDKYEKIYTWTKTLSASDVKSIVGNIGNILGISITKTAPSGRVTELSVKGDRSSKPTNYTLERTRTIFGLKSQLYTISTDADVYTVTAYNASVVTAAAGAGVDASTVKSTAPEPKMIQLGDKKVISAAGTGTFKSSNNKVTILGANGVTNKVTLVPENYTFAGKGYGHAVGMSQEGAIGMAKAGFTYDAILTHYFQGTKIE
jgi:stage II sporulation protein D